MTEPQLIALAAIVAVAWGFAIIKKNGWGGVLLLMLKFILLCTAAPTSANRP
jgi:hypothetical protein